jgi:hypothetical protein
MQPAGQISPDGKWLWNGAQWVPYQQPAPTPVTWARPYESARARASYAVVALAASCAGIALLGTAGIVLEVEPAQMSDSQNLVVGLLSLVALLVFFGTYIPAIVFFLMWLHRVVRNMPALGAPDPRWSPGGAVGRCFIPFLNLFHPLYSVLDAWRGSDESRRFLDVAARKAIATPRVIAIWWSLWLAGAVASYINRQLSGGVSIVLDIVGGVGFIGAAVFAIQVVRQLTDRQDRKSEMIRSGQLI